MLATPMVASTAEMSALRDEKKVSEPEDDKITEAETLANEALRLATESKRAAEKLAEIRAAIAFLQSKADPSVQADVSKEAGCERVVPEPVSTSIVPVVAPSPILSKPEAVETPAAPVVAPSPIVEKPAAVESPAAPVVAPSPIQEKPEAVESPAAPVVAPSPIQKKPEAVETPAAVPSPALTVSTDVQAKEVPPAVVASPTVALSSPSSILKKSDSRPAVKEFRFSPDVVDQVSPVKAVPAVAPTTTVSETQDDEPLIVRFCDALGMERLCSLSIEREDIAPLTVQERMSYIKNAFAMEAEGGAFVAMVPPTSSSTPKSVPVVQSTAPVVAPAVESTVPVVASTAESTVPVDVPVVESTVPVVASTAESTLPVDVPAVESATPTSIVVPVEEATLVTSPAEGSEPLEAPKQPKVSLTVETSSSVMSETGEGVLSPIKKQILANAIAPKVIHKADPFAGELDDMDFDMVCGWGS
jgi:hypothetical protein